MTIKDIETIELSIKELQDNKLTPNQYCFLYDLYNKTKPRFPITIEDYDCLEQAYMIKKTEDEIALREKAYDLFELNESAFDKMFIDFYLTFPMKVSSRNGQTRPLRASTTDTANGRVVKNKYKKIVGVRGAKQKHEWIMKCLQAEVEHRKKSNSLAYMHNIETWLNQQDWEKFEYLVTDVVKAKKEETYGQQLI